jgi:hypothetical protein
MNEGIKERQRKVEVKSTRTKRKRKGRKDKGSKEVGVWTEDEINGERRNLW